MQTEQLTWNESAGWRPNAGLTDAGLVLCFGTNDALELDAWYLRLGTAA